MITTDEEIIHLGEYDLDISLSNAVDLRDIVGNPIFKLLIHRCKDMFTEEVMNIGNDQKRRDAACGAYRYACDLDMLSDILNEYISQSTGTSKPHK